MKNVADPNPDLLNKMYFIKYATISTGIGINLTLMGGMGINLTLTDPRHGHKLNVNGRHGHKLNT